MAVHHRRTRRLILQICVIAKFETPRKFGSNLKCLVMSCKDEFNVQKLRVQNQSLAKNSNGVLT